jgi:predicted transcriptional regulator
VAGFQNNGWRTSPERIAAAERHRVIIELRLQGLSQSEIAGRFGVTQQAVSKAILKHIRDLPATEAEQLRQEQLGRLAELEEAAIQILETATTDEARLQALNVLVSLEGRKSKLLGLDADAREKRAKANRESRALDPTKPDPVMETLLRDLQEVNQAKRRPN